MTFSDLQHAIEKYGIKFSLEGDSVRLHAEKAPPSELQQALREFKPELMQLLAAEKLFEPASIRMLSPEEYADLCGSRQQETAIRPEPDQRLEQDRRNWRRLAERVLGGEYDGADESTLRSLALGLRWFDAPVEKEALGRVEKLVRARKRKRKQRKKPRASPVQSTRPAHPRGLS